MSAHRFSIKSRRGFLAGSAAMIATPALAQSTSSFNSSATTETERDLTESVQRNVSSFRMLDWRPYFSNTRDGAVLVQSVEDVRELITAFDGTSPRSTFREEVAGWDFTEDVAPVDDSPAEIADLLTTAPVGVDELIRQTGASPSAVQLALLELELAGRLTRHAAGRVSLSG